MPTVTDFPRRRTKFIDHVHSQSTSLTCNLPPDRQIPRSNAVDPFYAELSPEVGPICKPISSRWQAPRRHRKTANSGVSPCRVDRNLRTHRAHTSARQNCRAAKPQITVSSLRIRIQRTCGDRFRLWRCADHRLFSGTPIWGVAQVPIGGITGAGQLRVHSALEFLSARSWIYGVDWDVP
jgi:hypothetical protein